MRAIKNCGLLILGSAIGAIGLACAQGMNIAVWYLDPSQGLVRKQSGQVLTWTQAKGYYCVSSTDMQTILAEYQACRQAGK